MIDNHLTINGLSKRFAGFKLQDISFTLPKGYIMGFVGPNGSGKTTTIQLILNMLKRDSGEIKVFGKDNLKEENTIKQDIGIVFDSIFFVDTWSVRETEKAVSIFYDNWRHDIFTDMLERFELPERKKVKDLSRGMQMKLMLACAFSHDAKLLILDEPTSGLDPVSRDELCDLLADFVTDDKRSVLFSTHITTDLEKIADYITFILGGQIVFTGTKEDLIEKYVMVKGGLDELDSRQKECIIGLRRHGTGFEGIAKAADMHKFSKKWLVEPVALDDIIIHISAASRES